LIVNPTIKINISIGLTITVDLDSKGEDIVRGLPGEFYNQIERQHHKEFKNKGQERRLRKYFFS